MVGFVSVGVIGGRDRGLCCAAVRLGAEESEPSTLFTFVNFYLSIIISIIINIKSGKIPSLPTPSPTTTTNELIT